MLVALAISLGAAWFLTTRHVGAALLVLGVYLATLDGPIRLFSGLSATSAGRDILAYALATNVFLRRRSGQERRAHPPYLTVIVAIVALCCAQLLNPYNNSVAYSLVALRPHLEWLPMFYLGYVLLRDLTSLRAASIVLSLVSVANGVVGLVQFLLTPAQLAAWGPGYDSLVFGGGVRAGRTFFDSGGVEHVRPFALGPDTGFGGYIGALALPATLALLFQPKGRYDRAIGAVGLAGSLLAVGTSQSRSALIAAILAVVIYMVLAARARLFLPGVGALGFLTVGAAVLTLGLQGKENDPKLSRYRTVLPDRVLSTTIEYRAFNLADFDSYLKRFPAGAGIGSSSPPAASLLPGGGPALAGRLDTESELTFLLVELGIPGLLLFAGFTLALIARAVAGLPQPGDPDAVIYLSAVVASISVIAALWIASPVTARTPTAPMFWLCAGAIGWWMATPTQRAMRREMPALTRV